MGGRGGGEINRTEDLRGRLSHADDTTSVCREGSPPACTGGCRRAVGGRTRHGRELWCLGLGQGCGGVGVWGV